MSRKSPSAQTKEKFCVLLNAPGSKYEATQASRSSPRLSFLRSGCGALGSEAVATASGGLGLGGSASGATARYTPPPPAIAATSTIGQTARLRSKGLIEMRF